MTQRYGPRVLQYVLLVLALGAMLHGVRARYRTMVERTIAAAQSASAATSASAAASAPASPRDAAPQ